MANPEFDINIILGRVSGNLDDKTLDNWGAAFNAAAQFEFKRHVQGGDLGTALRMARRAGLKAVFIAMATEGVEPTWPKKVA